MVIFAIIVHITTSYTFSEHAVFDVVTAIPMQVTLYITVNDGQVSLPDIFFFLLGHVIRIFALLRGPRKHNRDPIGRDFSLTTKC